MKIAVTGDIEIRDKNKITGFVDAFSSIYHTQHFAPPLRNHITNNSINVLFGESGDFFDVSYKSVKNVFLWSVMDIEELARNNPNTNFYMCSKSILHDPDVIEEYLTKGFEPEYMRYGLEGINLIHFRDKIEKGRKINDDVYQLSDNLYYMYLPCCLAQSNIRQTTTKDIDVTYFGTINNRPNVAKLLSMFEQHGLKVNYNRQGFIAPEDCIGYYNRSIVTLHEQVGPVLLEYPVRQGESTMCNSKLFTISNLPSMEKFASNHVSVPTYSSFNNVQDLFDSALQYIGEYKNEINRFNHDKPNTYKHYANIIVDLCK